MGHITDNLRLLFVFVCQLRLYVDESHVCWKGDSDTESVSQPTHVFLTSPGLSIECVCDTSSSAVRVALPKFWRMGTDPRSGKRFFYQHHTGVVSSKRPKG